VGRRREFAAFGWRPEDVPDPQDPATFERSKLDWSQPSMPRHADLLAWHRRLIELRREFVTDRSWPDVRCDEDTRWLVMRHSGLTVAGNLGDSTVDIEVDDAAKVVLASDEPGTALDGGRLRLAPHSVAVLT
jgi:maltooligosyltrehalose trehalohydrolase